MIHRLAWTALICVIVLVFVGAIVRVTGSGLGCPDWPTCWGCLIPPTSADQIDVAKLDLEKFKRHAARKGIDPDSITRETILESFDPVHTWIEFVNRLTSLPLGLASLLLALFSFRAKKHRGWVIGLSWFSLFDVLGNAVMGAMVVRSGLQPGIITLHMALAFLLIAVLVTVIWLTRPEPSFVKSAPLGSSKLLVVSWVFFACLFGEGLMASQVREQTDELQKTVATASESNERASWSEELGKTLVYKVHRSFSWVLLITAILIFRWRGQLQQPAREPTLILGFIVAMMLMGVVMAHIAVFQAVQVLHVGSTAVLLAIAWHWLVRLMAANRSKELIATN